MKKFIFLLFIITSCTDRTIEKSHTKSDIDFTTVFEKSEGLETATYDETIRYYSNLADSYSEVSIREIGETDSGKPLHLVTLNMNDSDDDFESLRKNNRILLINNGIHPGESDGIDACLLYTSDAADD